MTVGTTIQIGLGSWIGFLTGLFLATACLIWTVRSLVHIASAIANVISKAFVGPTYEPPLSRAQFEAKYGPMRDDLIEDACEIKRQSQPVLLAFGVFVTAMLVGTIWGILTIITSGPTAQWFSSMIALAIVGMACMIVITVWDERRTGPARRAWQEKVREVYDVAPEDRITFKLARRA